MNKEVLLSYRYLMREYSSAGIEQDQSHRVIYSMVLRRSPVSCNRWIKDALLLLRTLLCLPDKIIQRLAFQISLYNLNTITVKHK